MSDLAVQQFEPVYLELEPARITEYGKGWLDRRLQQWERWGAILQDVAKLAVAERWRWPRIIRQLEEEGVPTAISSGISQYAMPKLMDHLNGKTSFTIPATVALALGIGTAPTSTSTGAMGANEANYTTYGRQTIAAAGWNASTAATPSVATNASTITFAACTAGTSNLIGFEICDSATINAGNSLWYGTLSPTTISVTQTPPTVAAGALSVSLTGT